MSKPVIIIGAGGHARVLHDCLRMLGVDVLGALDKSPLSNCCFELPILGDDSAIAAYSPRNVELINGIGSVVDTHLRAVIYEKFKKLGHVFRTVVHPTAVMAQDCILGEGVQVMARAVVNTGTNIGYNSIINTGAIVDHECYIGNHVHIAPGCTLSGGVQVGDGTHIGTGATVIQGIRIGEQALVAAGAVVIRDVPPGGRIAGVPAKAF